MRRDLVIAAMAGDHEAFSELTRLSVDQLHVIARSTSTTPSVRRTRPRKARRRKPEWTGAAAGWSTDGTTLLGGLYVHDPSPTAQRSPCTVGSPCRWFELQIIDADGVDPTRSIPISDNAGIISWQRLAD
jgi:hypothetical protein